VSKAAAAYAEETLDAYVEEALDWFIRVQDPEFAEWDALSAWLAANARHAEIIQKLAMSDEAITTDIAGHEHVTS
jgi:transmembrane sensor